MKQKIRPKTSENTKRVAAKGKLDSPNDKFKSSLATQQDTHASGHQISSDQLLSHHNSTQVPKP